MPRLRDTPESGAVRVSFTLAPDDVQKLGAIVEHRHPQQFRADSMTVRELIREEFARIEREAKKR